MKAGDGVKAQASGLFVKDAAGGFQAAEALTAAVGPARLACVKA